MDNNKIAEALKVLQDAAEHAIKQGFYGTLYGQPYTDGMKIIHIEPNEAKLAKNALCYTWGWPGPDFNVYYFWDYGKTWALTKEEIISQSKENNHESS